LGQGEGHLKHVPLAVPNFRKKKLKKEKDFFSKIPKMQKKLKK